MALSAADFQDYQAARAVLGQASFSAHEKGVSGIALSLVKGNLNVADNSGHVLIYDLSRLGASTSSGCPVCQVSPQSTLAQNVFQGVAAVSVYGRNIAIADPQGHRVMLWNSSSSFSQPAIVLSGLSNPTSVALDSQRLFVGDAGSHHVYIWNQLPTSASQPPDVTLGVADGLDSPAADTIQTPTALESDGTNLYVADAAAHRVLIFSASDSATPAVVNAATLDSGAVAPGTLISLEDAVGTVFLNGAPLPVTDVNAEQLQVQVPYELGAATSGSLWIQTPAGNSRAVAVRFSATSPGIFAFGTKEPRTGLILHQAGAVPLSPEEPAKPLEVLTAWTTGLGAVSTEPNADGSVNVLTPVHASVNGAAVEVVSARLPADAIGIYEVRLRLPADVSGSVTLTLSQNDVKSNTVTFPVQPVTL